MVLVISFASQSKAGKPINLEPIGYGRLLHINGLIKLPTGQKLNKAAPSQIQIYEKLASEWQLTETVNLNDFFTLTESINFQRPIKLMSEVADIKLKSSLYHCPKFGRGICVIDDYEGIVKRSPNKASSEVQLSLVGSDPK